MIHINNVNKIIKNNHILKNINLRLREKELVCILGPSGSGKTTLLNLIGKINEPTTGKILYKNKDIKNIPEEYYHNHIVSFIFQDYNLLKNLSIKDNILLPSKISKNNIIDINSLIRKLKLKINKKTIKDLSGGEKQRVAIARSIISNSKIILADEPTGALDSKNSEIIMKLLKEISKEKLVIVVTHNEKLASIYADRIIKLKDGLITSDSKPYQNNNKKYKEEIIKKEKIFFIELYKLSINNLLSKKKRNILTSIAFSIGLFSLAIILSINNGFKKEIKNYEELLYSYPLIISKEAISLNENIFKEQIYDKNIVNINKNNGIITNNINDELLNKIKTINKSYIDDITYYNDIDIYFKNISYVLPNIDGFKLIKGNMPQNKNEALLLLDYNYAIDENVRAYLNINSQNFDDYLNIRFKVDNKELIITGIVYSENEYFSSLNGILYQKELFEGKITDIYIYPNNYNNKVKIKEILKDINIIDNAESAINMSKNMIDIISYILIIFSLISLLVSCIMIYIITYISVIEREKEIGILRSIGFRKKDIKKMFLYENLTIGIISTCISLLLTYSFSNIINKYILNTIGIKKLLIINSHIIITIFLISLILTYISSVIPSKKASKKTIYESLRSIN